MRLQRTLMLGRLEVDIIIQTRNGRTHSLLTQYGSDQMMGTMMAAAKAELQMLENLPTDCVEP